MIDRERFEAFYASIDPLTTTRETAWLVWQAQALRLTRDRDETIARLRRLEAELLRKRDEAIERGREVFRNNSFFIVWRPGEREAKIEGRGFSADDFDALASLIRAEQEPKP